MRRSVSLSTPGESEQEWSASVGSVRLFEEEPGVGRIELSGAGETLSAAVVESLVRGLEKAQQIPSVKVWLLRASDGAFPGGGREQVDAGIQGKLYESLSGFDSPLIAEFPSGALGAGLLVGLLCDFMVCAREGIYGYVESAEEAIEERLFASEWEAGVLAERLGQAQAQDLLLHSGGLSGAQLQARGWRCPIVPAAEVKEAARQLARTLAGKSREGLSLLKQHLGWELRERVGRLRTDSAIEATAEALIDVASLSSSVALSSVRLEPCGEGVLLLRMSRTPGSEGVSRG